MMLSTAEFLQGLFVCCRMSELNITDDQIDQFLKNERPLWPQAPAPCVVSTCDQARNYSSFRDFMDHWRDKHSKTKTHYKCLSCRRLFATNKHKKAHEKSKLHQGQSVEIELVEKPNESYIDPQDKLPYQLGTVDYRTDMRKLQREMAKVKRKMDADMWAAANEEKYTEEEINHHVCRDERVVERNGVMYKDTNMWDSPRRRKRTRLN